MKSYYAKINRIRWMNGMPQILCHLPNKHTRVPFAFWVTIEQHPMLCGNIDRLLALPIRQIGSFKKFMKKMYY